MATMKDIANLVGVSLTTVSNVVHGNYDRVSPQTVQRILDAIEQLHYVPNMSARALVSHSSRIIAFVDTHSPQETYAGNGFAGVLLSGLEGVVTDHGYFLMMRRGTNEDVLRLMLNNWNPDGVIFKDRVPQSLVDFVKKQGKPCVTINTYLDDPGLIQVRAEDRRGGYLAARHLIELGHRNILFIGAVNRGFKTVIAPAFGKTMLETDCVFCGQCINACPVGALRERDDTGLVFDAIDDPNTVTVAQVAPAVRAAWAEQFGLDSEFATPKRMVAALRELGFNYVFDTDFAADLTIMEEGSEFIERFTHKDQYQWPMFTSCCPGWVRFVKSQYPELTDNLSTAKSPQQMFGAVAKSYFAEKVGIDPKRLFVVSIMPCVSKKSECALPTMKNDAGDPDVDVSITTRELNIMMRANHIEPKYLPEEEFDSPLGSATGAAVVFGTTGGVMDAALRSAYFLVTGKNPDPDAFTAVRGMDGWKEATFNIPGAGDVRVAVVSSLGKARKLIEAVKRGDAAYDFVEVMACPGGCAGGGGQPIHDGTELAEDRGNVLWRLDQGELLRFSHENPDVKALYRDYLGSPLGEKSHHLLHTDHNAWQMPQKML